MRKSLHQGLQNQSLTVYVALTSCYFNESHNHNTGTCMGLIGKCLKKKKPVLWGRETVRNPSLFPSKLLIFNNNCQQQTHTLFY